MGDLIRNGEIANDDLALASLAEFQSNEDQKVGVWLEADEEADAILSDLSGISVIALNFPAFSDGRAYSTANILRRQLHYKGEIRAIGDVRIDQLEQMLRCGFDAFQLADGQDSTLAVEKLKGFSHSYQATIDREPLFKQRR
jgi:uncharacterized protein (DUF934 family)